MSTKLHIAAVLGFCILLPIAHATEWESMMEETDVWQGIIDDDAREQDMQTADRTFQENTKELFPDFSNGSDDGTSVLDEKRQERTEEFVSVVSNGSLIVFIDVPRTAWFAPYVRTIAENGLISGYRDAAGNPTGKFGPADKVTIEQMAKIVVTAIGIDQKDCPKSTLNLTASGSWSAPYFACAESHQLPIIGDGSVDAHRPATRSEVIATILTAYDVTTGTGAQAVFTDVEPTMQFGSLIAKAKIDGIISGYTDANGNPTGKFGPNDPVTRAEFAKMMSLGIDVYGGQ